MTAQSQFVTALFDPEQPVPVGLVNPDGSVASKRFDVYRNNVAVSLTDALQSGFPLLHKLLGEKFFNAMAGVFLRKFPPSSPLMMHYGTQMPRFLKRFPPVKHLPYLPDVARLELALRTAYHAADADPMDVTVLQNLSAQDLMAIRLALTPATQVIASPYPIHAIWWANTDPQAPKPTGADQTVLITRPNYDPQVDLISPAAAGFITALQDRQSFAEALHNATEINPNFDLTPTLGLLLSRNALTSPPRKSTP